MPSIKVTFHGTNVPNGEPLTLTSANIEGERTEIATSMVKAMSNQDSLVLTGNSSTTIVNLKYVAMIEVAD